MGSRIYGIGVLAVALLVHTPLLAQQASTRPVMVVVNDQTGVAIAHAQIRLVPAPDPPPAKMETDAQGHLLLDLKPGTYGLFVSAQGFKEAAPHIEVAGADGGAGTAQIISVALRIGDVNSPAPVYPADSLVLAADRLHVPVVLSPAEFRALAHSTITVHKAHSDADERYSGVPLIVLLAKLDAPAGDQLRGKALASYIVASGSDGYSVVLSIAEADPSFHGGEILVADTRDGQPLGKSGPFQLIVSEDKRPARWVHNLVSISLHDAR
jgi:Carboxypeptidase regulatory-like domain